MASRFTDKVVVVTGAAGGLGRGLAQGFGAEGAQLVLVDIDEKGLAETTELLTQAGVRSSTHRVDLSSEQDIQAFGATVCQNHPKVDALLNNAGLAYGEIAHQFETLSQEKWLRFLSINTVTPLLLAQALRPALAAAQGVIINLTSMASYMPGTAYGVTKAALNAITYGMASSFGRDGIRVNGVAPGLMETKANKDQLPQETHERIRGMQMLDAHGTPEHITDLTLFLASNEARFISCEIVSCDAGNRMRSWRY